MTIEDSSVTAALQHSAAAGGAAAAAPSESAATLHSVRFGATRRAMRSGAGGASGVDAASLPPTRALLAFCRGTVEPLERAPAALAERIRMVTRAVAPPLQPWLVVRVEALLVRDGSAAAAPPASQSRALLASPAGMDVALFAVKALYESMLGSGVAERVALVVDVRTQSAADFCEATALGFTALSTSHDFWRGVLGCAPFIPPLPGAAAGTQTLFHLFDV